MNKIAHNRFRRLLASINKIGEDAHTKSLHRFSYKKSSQILIISYIIASHLQNDSYWNKYNSNNKE